MMVICPLNIRAKLFFAGMLLLSDDGRVWEIDGHESDGLLVQSWRDGIWMCLRDVLPMSKIQKGLFFLYKLIKQISEVDECSRFVFNDISTTPFDYLWTASQHSISFIRSGPFSWRAKKVRRSSLNFQTPISESVLQIFKFNLSHHVCRREHHAFLRLFRSTRPSDSLYFYMHAKARFGPTCLHTAIRKHFTIPPVLLFSVPCIENVSLFHSSSTYRDIK